MTDPLELLRQLVELPAPPGQEKAVHDWLDKYLRDKGYAPETDAKGNLLVRLGSPHATPKKPSVLVTAHMDEIALMVTKIEADGKIRVVAQGGSFTWKWGEGPMDILTAKGTVPAVLSYGCAHTNSEASVAQYARNNPLKWEQAYLFSGLDATQLEAEGVRPGLRVVLSASRRVITHLGPFIASYFLDDRACLVAWLMALEMLQSEGQDDLGEVTFAATASEEAGCMGAKYLLSRHPADICVAIEIGPTTPESEFPIDAQPTIWVKDDTAAMQAEDGDILSGCCAELGQSPHWQYLSMGGSDATRSAVLGLTARPVTLGLPTENSHGYEIIHRDSLHEMARLLTLYLRRI